MEENVRENKMGTMPIGRLLLTMALLGVSFYALSYNYTVSEKRQEMRDRADLVAQLSVDYLTAGDDTERDQEEALRTLAGVASRMTEVDFLICLPPVQAVRGAAEFFP